ncbi:unnamed protein product [Cuscuta epithymum]|uniref:Integrase catalytic domain-containing protein n=1 Tax=Cuscuta epithymum TaxID=186058 RepID=A0AAV0FJV1_9ASTE|nr:unnamed protein product [Cuscuta epithymum]
MTIKMHDRSFPLELKNGDHVAYPSAVSKSKLLHSRLGHCSYTTMSQMHKHSMVENMPSVVSEDGVCCVCEKGKSSKSSFNKDGVKRAKDKLELIHSDICGPMSVESLNGSKYFLLFIDDYSRTTWCYFLKQKSEVFNHFVAFKKAVEKEAGKVIKVFRTDNGGEFCSHQFESFLKDHGIVHQKTNPYTPQQNGVSERKNRSVMNMSRCLMFEKDLPKQFWAEAVNTAVYLLNRISTKSLDNKTPYEAWSGYKPKLDHLRVFGSPCYTHVPDVKRDKLDARAVVGIFIGYSSITKGYRVFSLKTKKVEVSRDVRIDEGLKWNWEKMAIEEDDQFDDVLEAAQPEDALEDAESERIDHVPIRGTRSLNDVYARCNLSLHEPTSTDEALEIEVWRHAMQDEISAIEKNETWKLVNLPTEKKAIGVRWIYRTKLNPDGTVSKYKARLVVKGYAQNPGVDYFETFSPVARMETIRLLLSLAAQQGWKVCQLDVKSAFLNGFLQEDIYVEQPEGYVVAGSESKVYKLNKALYGLKQAPRSWYDRLDACLIEMEFEKSKNEATLYVKELNQDILIVSVYVDDLLITGSSIKMIDQFKSEMKKKFDMSDLGLMSYFLGLEVVQMDCGILIHQRKFATEVLKKFAMSECKPIGTPLATGQKFFKEDGTEKIDSKIYRSLMGSLLYLTASRPDLVFSVNLLSRFMHSPSEQHFKAAKRILRYVQGTADYGVFYGKNPVNLIGFTDSDLAGSDEESRSVFGYCFSLGSGMISWKSKKQSVVAQSTAEAEYIAASKGGNQAVWLRKILVDLKLEQKNATVMFCDSKAAIAIIKNPVLHDRTKHFKIKFHSVRQLQNEGDIDLQFCSSEEQTADILTKILPKHRFDVLCERLGMRRLSSMGEC